jgi:TetR/AcrR family transcriptional repressor of uid operon
MKKERSFVFIAAHHSRLQDLQDRPVAKLSPETLRERSDHILDAAGHCFARAGFHRTTMQDICREAAVSPGALYIYFSNKEALIAGIAERERAVFADRFAQIAGAPDFMGALAMLGRRFLVEDPPYRRILCIEIGLEATRNPKIGEIQRTVEVFIRDCFRDLFDTVVEAFMTIADGMLWRRAVDPDFNADIVLPPLLDAVGALLRPVADETKP